MSSIATSPPGSALAALTKKVVLGFVGTWVIALMAANMVPVLIAAMVQDLGVDIATAGALATGMTAASAIAMFVTNRFVALADRPRLGRIGLIVMILGYGAAAIILNVPAVMGGLMLGGVGAGVMIATGTAAASSTNNPDRSVAVIMIINRLGATALLAIAPLFHNDLRAVLFAIASLGVIGLLLAGGLPNMPNRHEIASQRRQASSRSGSATSVFTVSAFVIAISMCLWSLTEDMVYSMTSVLSEQAGVTPEFSSTLLAGKVFGGLIGALLAPVILRWFGRSWSFVLFIGLSTITKFIMITIGSDIAYSVSILLWGVMYGAILVLVTGLAAVMDLTGRTGVLVSGFYLARVAFGPLIGGQLVGILNPVQYALLVTLPSVVFGLALFMLSQRRNNAQDSTFETTGQSEAGQSVDVAMKPEAKKTEGVS